MLLSFLHFKSDADTCRCRTDTEKALLADIQNLDAYIVAVHLKLFQSKADCLFTRRSFFLNKVRHR